MCVCMCVCMCACACVYFTRGYSLLLMTEYKMKYLGGYTVECVYLIDI